MVISTQHKYIFIQIPHTASTAVARELCTHYQGVQVLHKHATRADLERAAGHIPATYRVIAGIRNPLEMFHTKFSKRNSNHRDMFTEKKDVLQRHRRGRKHLREFAYTQRHPDDFTGFFKAFAPRIYNDLAGGLPRPPDILLRHHQLDQDFSAMIQTLGLSLVQVLPVHNATQKQHTAIDDIYAASIQQDALFRFGPYMRHWGFPPPPGWTDTAHTVLADRLFSYDTQLRNLYYNFCAKRRVQPNTLSL